VIIKKSANLAGALVLAAAALAFGQAPVTQKLAAGTYVVYAPSPQVWRVRFDPATMANASITGHFQVTEGTPKNLDVLVFNQENYAKWASEDPADRAAAKPLATVARAAEGDINAKLSDPGFHYLVLSNRYQYEGRKTVSADIKLQYDKR
jgi:hypothetical protein